MQPVGAVEVYVATNVANGKIYVGITKVTLKKRRSQHFSMAENNKSYGLFAKAIRKHGRDKFKFEVTAVARSWDDALDVERHLIETTQPEYNVSAGGIGPNGIKWTENRRNKAIVGMRMAWTPERKAKISAMFRGKSPSRASVEKMKLKNPWRVFYRPVICLNDGAVYGSIKAAAASYGISAKQIGTCCAGVECTAAGKSFEYYTVPMSDADRGVRLLEIETRKAASVEARRKSRCRAVICTTTGKTYESARAAANGNNICIMRVSQICRHGGKTNCGLEFRYVGHPEPTDPKLVSDEQYAIGRAKRMESLAKVHAARRKAVVCLDTGEEFDSISLAARSVGACIESMSASIKRRGRCKKMRFAFKHRNDT